LKIDRTFIQDLRDGSDDAAIATAIINMAKCLKLRVTAEGVERAGQLSQLRKYGCDEAQGCFFGQPLSATEVTAKLSERSLATPVRNF
jgi:EAL domain-containing protein (putative c-di-GMP-specific phosphodiesterase class I)